MDSYRDDLERTPLLRGRPRLAPGPASPDLEKSIAKQQETVATATERSSGRLTPVLLMSVLAAVVGSSTQFGYNSGVLNSPKKAIEISFDNGTHSEVPFTANEMTVAVAIFAIGGMFGALCAGLFADLIGRKYSLLLNNIVVLVGMVLESIAVHPAMFIMGRFVIGINSGINTVLVPLYISEVSPIKLRGAMGVLHQMAISTTIMLSEVLGLRVVLGRPDRDFYGWNILFVLFAFPFIFVVFQLVLLPFCPESPRFLYIMRKKEEAAIRALVRLRGSADVQGEIKELEDECIELQKPRKTVGAAQFFRRPSLRRALLVSIVLHLCRQFCGIAGIIYYSTEIFSAAGLRHADVSTVVVGVVLVVFTMVTVFLIEMVGRRTLMLYGVGGMAVAFSMLTAMFCFQDGFYSDADVNITAPGVLLVTSALGAVALFALGPGTIPWLMVAELFLQETRPIAITVATIVNWFSNCVVGLAFPYILKYLYPYGTAIFIVTCSVFWLFLYVYLPETKGRRVEDIVEEFRRRSGERVTREGLSELSA